MRLARRRTEIVADGRDGAVVLDVRPRHDGWSWSVANSDGVPVRVRSVALVFALDGATAPLRMFRHGYQSWSPTGVATFGVDHDPSTRADFELLQAVHHADQRRARDEELRSEWVTVLCAAGGTPMLLGFLGGEEHDGTFRLRRAGDGGIELWVEAFLGDATLAPGQTRPLHDVDRREDDGRGPSALLEEWAAAVGRRGRARVHAPYQVGWCSWYHYFHGITEHATRANLALADAWPFDVFQLDDGYQAAIGDWLRTNERFPSGLAPVAGAIRAAGRTPGIWLAPFLAAPDSELATEHPDWLARHGPSGGPLVAWWNPAWGGGRDGLQYALDTTNPEVDAHLEHVARTLVGLGYRYLKLDFTFAPSVDGRWHDPTRTPAQRVRAGYDAIRRGAGDDTFILGCGVPLGPVVGVVDGNRIGQDVAPTWTIDPAEETVPGYLAVEPATVHAYGNALTRSFMHRALWLNDPDCLMLRTRETAMSVDAVRTWAHTVAVSGGMALVSDDLALLDADARALLDDVLEIGRASDDAAAAGTPARCSDLLDHAVPEHLAGGGYAIEVDPVSARSSLTRPVP